MDTHTMPRTAAKSPSTPSPTGPSQARARPRRRLLKAGIILFNDRRSTVPCTIRDVSETGARITVAPGAMVPAEFVLFFELDGIESDCEIAWRRGEHMGLRFVGPVRDVEPVRMQVVSHTTEPPRPSLRRKPSGSP